MGCLNRLHLLALHLQIMQPFLLKSYQRCFSPCCTLLSCYMPALRAEAGVLLAMLAKTIEGDGAPIWQRALSLEERRLGPEHPAVASTCASLAAVLHDQEPRAAEALAARALSIRVKRLGPTHPLVAASCTGLAGVVSSLGDNAEAQRLRDRAKRIRRAQRP